MLHDLQLAVCIEAKLSAVTESQCAGQPVQGSGLRLVDFVQAYGSDRIYQELGRAHRHYNRCNSVDAVLQGFLNLVRCNFDAISSRGALLSCAG